MYSQGPIGPPSHSFAFQFMVGVGLVMMASASGQAGVGGESGRWKRSMPYCARLALTAPLGYLRLFLEFLVWVVTEVGPATMDHLWCDLRTSEAVTPMHGTLLPYGHFFCALWNFSCDCLVWLLRRHIAEAQSAQVF